MINLREGWSGIQLEGFRVIGDARFMRQHGQLIPKWVKEFIAKNAKKYAFGNAVYIDDAWIIEVGDELKVIQFSMTDPQGTPTIIIGDYNQLILDKVIRRTAQDGQNRTSL